MSGFGARQAAERAVRDSYGRLVGLLASRGVSLAEAEDALSEAFATALAQWPKTGVPNNPEAWLFAVARRRQIDAARRQGTARTGVGHLRLIAEELAEEEMNAPDIPDRRLALMFACTHPVVDPSVQAALMLNVVLGLTAAEIAPAYLVADKTMGQRLSRAKARLKEAGVAFEVPEAQDLPERLAPVLDAVYAAYGRSYSEDAGRGPLAGEAAYLVRLTARLTEAPEALGLCALVLYSEARAPARRSKAGAYVPLDEQDPGLWQLELVAEAERCLRVASARGPSGRFQIEAAIQSALMAERLTGLATGTEVVALYDLLLRLHPGPVVRLNRAIAIARRDGPVAGLAEMDGLADDPAMASYQPYWAARFRLLADSGDRDGAAEAARLAIGLSQDPAVRAWLQARLPPLGRGCPTLISIG